MAGHASFAQRLVFEDERPALRRVTLEAGVVLGQQSGAATLERLLAAGAAAFDRVSLMRVVAICAAHFSFEDRMVIGQFELAPALPGGIGNRWLAFARVDDGVKATAALDVKAARPVTRFATHVFGVLAGRL